MAIPLGSILPSLGNAFGTGLAQPISQGLDLLAQRKLAQLQQNLRQSERGQMAQEKVPGLQALFPQFNQEQLSGLAMLDPKTLGKLIEQSQGQQQENILKTVEEQLQSGQEPSAESALQQLMPERIQTAQQQQPMQQQQQQQPQMMPPQEQPMVQSPVSGKAKTLTPGLKAERETALLDKILSARPDLSAVQKQQLRERIEKRHDKLMAEQEKINTKNAPFIDEAKKAGEGGEANLSRLNAMEALVQKGDLANPVVASALETLAHGAFGFGVDLFSLTSKDTQKFRKLQKDFLKNAKSIFGSRVTEGEIRLLLETFPSLSQTDAGKLEIIDMLKPVAYAQKATQDSIDEIQKEYNGHLPPNFKQLVKDRTEEKKDTYAKELKAGIKTRKHAYKAALKQHPIKHAIRRFVPGTSEFFSKK